MSTRTNCSNRWKPWLSAGQSGPAPSGDALLAVANIAALAALDTSTIDDGGVVSVKSVLDLFMLDKTSALAPDGITVVAASGGGNWLRLEISSREWILQPTWYIDAVGGNDENSGAGAANSLKTFAEWKRRVGRRLEIPQTINLENDIAEDMLFDQDGVIGVYIVIQGQRTVLYSGSVTASQAYNPATSTDGQITDGAIPVSWTASGLVDKLIVKKTGTGAGSCGWVAKDMGAQTARYSPLLDANTYTVYDFANGDTFDVVSLTKVTGNFVSTGSANVMPVDLEITGTGYDECMCRDGGWYFPTYCNITSPYVLSVGGGYADYQGCRIKPGNQRIVSGWGGTQYFDACLLKGIVDIKYDGYAGVLTNTIAQGDVGGGTITVNVVASQVVFPDSGGWFASFDDPTATPTLQVTRGSSLYLNNYFWGFGASPTYAVVVAGASTISYNPGAKPSFVGATVRDVDVAGLNRTYAQLPVHNASKMCGVVEL
jgi:hypothetical protein